MTKTVEQALLVNIFQISKATRRAHSSVITLEWVFGVMSIKGVVLLVGDTLGVMVGGRVHWAKVSYREFRKNRFQPHIQCRACGKKCHILYVEDEGLQCRRCASLIYECQRGHGRERAFLKARKLINRLKGQPCDLVPPRPQGMWRKTYRHKVRCLLQAQQFYYASFRPKEKTDGGVGGGQT